MIIMNKMNKITTDYSPLPTADFDECQDDSEHEKVLWKSQGAESLEDSIVRVGELSSKISNEIELQNLCVRDLEQNQGEMDDAEEYLLRQSRRLIDDHLFRDNLICGIIVLIIVLLLIGISVKVFYKYEQH